MIYIACALYDEALPWIEWFKLKKNTEASKFQIFEGEAAYLVITGTGIMKAAVGLTYLATLHMPRQNDIFMNTGVCGASKDVGAEGSLYLIHKITGASSGRSHYPDILYTHSFAEGEVTSFFEIQKTPVKGQLTDMEAEGLYCAASTFFGPDKMLFFKYISDFGDGVQVTRQKVRYLSKRAAALIGPWLEQAFLKEPAQMDSVYSFEKNELHSYGEHTWPLPEAAEQVDRLLNHLKATVAMKNKLISHLYYNALCGRDTTELLEEILKTPCRNKNEGRLLFNRLLEILKTGV